MILDNFPDLETFYRDYWHKKPFIVRGYVPQNAFDNFIDAETLAGLSLEDDIKSRLITNSADGDEWHCQHGPFDEDHFETLGDKNWSILVQNVEQYHKPTAALLSYFDISPRWLIDDIMISYSTIGGSVGPHKDSYHTFLVQGTGRRTWRISENAITDNEFAQNGDIRILKNSFEGQSYEVTCGDVIYMPPHFGHEGITNDNAMTFSVGFQGPKLSEILSEYAYFLEENEALNTRFLGEDLSTKDNGINLSKSTIDHLQNIIKESTTSEHFQEWLVRFFTETTHISLDETSGINRLDDVLRALENGHKIPEHIKLAITPHEDGFILSAFGETAIISHEQKSLYAL